MKAFIHKERGWQERLISIVLVISIVSSLVWIFPLHGLAADDFAGGSGTAADPYRIATAQHLKNIGNYLGPDYRNTYFRLENDIVLTGNWTPIGKFEYSADNSKTQFNGHLDGAGYEIANLTVPMDNTVTHRGLFASVDGADIRNLGVLNASVEGVSSVGALAGRAAGSTFINCYASGKILAGGPDNSHPLYGWYAGGLVGGGSSNSYTNCYFMGKVTGKYGVGGISGMEMDSRYRNCAADVMAISLSMNAGGIVGNLQYGSIRDCSVNALPTAEESNAGGIAGSVQHAQISGCTAVSVVYAKENAGGITGSMNDTSVVAYCTVEAESRVSAERSAGGITGTGGTVEQCLANCAVTAPQQRGGIAGSAAKALRDNYFNKDRNPGLPVNADGATGITEENMRNDATYANWDMGTYWYKHADGYPAPKNAFFYAGWNGDGTQENPYRIRHGFQLYALRNLNGPQYGSLHFLMERDIDLQAFMKDSLVEEVLPISDTGWNGIGTSSGRYSERIYFHFDGGNHTIQNLWGTWDSGNKTARNYGGLFRFLQDTTVKNLRLTLGGSGIKGETFLGALAGKIENTSVENCHLVSGTLEGTGEIGGLVAIAEDSDIVGCTSAATLKIGKDGTRSVSGGIVGRFVCKQKDSKIDNCVYTGAIMTEGDYAGGICGALGSGTISNCSAQDITITSEYGRHLGGIIGMADTTDPDFSVRSRTIQNCYSSGKIEGYSSLGGLAGTFVLPCDAVNSSSWMTVHAVKMDKTTASAGAAGGLVGTMTAGNISYCHATGEVTADMFVKGTSELILSGSIGIGGLVGEILKGGAVSITNSYATGNVSGSQAVGGLLGGSDSDTLTIQDCFATGNVYGCLYIGGLLGDIADATVQNCYATGEVQGNNTCGGLIGNANAIRLQDSYAQGNVTTARQATAHLITGNASASVGGGLVGSLDVRRAHTITRCYSSGTVEVSNLYRGGLVGRVAPNATNYLTFDHCFYNNGRNRAIGNTESIYNDGNSGTVSRKSLNDLQKTDTFSVWGSNISSSSTGNTKWYQASSSLPVLRTIKMRSGAGSQTTPFTISTPVELDRLHAFTGAAFEGKYFKLEQNIDLLGYTARSNDYGWRPVGSSSQPFAAKVDGNNKIVSGLWSNRNHDNGGLFGYFTGTVKNLGVETAPGKFMRGTANAGILAGVLLFAQVSGCYAKGVAYGASAGVFAGAVYGGTVQNCYAEGTVQTYPDTAYGAGFVYRADYATIQNCYAAATLKGSNGSGFCHVSSSANIVSCYYDQSLCNKPSASGFGRTTAQMMARATFPDWDFSDTWSINAGVDYPRLAGETHLDGAGTEDDPYRIYTAAQLDSLRDFSRRRDIYFKLMNDIDLTAYLADAGAGDGKGWLPIGVSSDGFRSHLDGNGKTISGLWINRPDSSYVGLFGYITTDELSTYSVKNLTVTVDNAKGGVQGNEQVGALAGDVFRALIEDVTVRGLYGENAKIGGTRYVGGILGGLNAGTLSGNTGFVQACAAVTAQESAGGLVGRMQVTTSGTQITKLQKALVYGSVRTQGSSAGGAAGIVGRSELYQVGAFSDVSSSGQMVGGLAGSVSSSVSPVKITQCFAVGKVSGTQQVGGLAGSVSNADILNCYAAGAVSGTSYVGGLIGRLFGQGTLKSSYAAGQVTATGNFRYGLAGVSSTSWPATDCMFDKDTTGATAGGTALTTGEMVAAGLLASPFEHKTGSYYYLSWQNNIPGFKESGILSDLNILYDSSKEPDETTGGSVALDPYTFTHETVLKGKNTFSRISAAPGAPGTAVVLDMPELTAIGQRYRGTVLSSNRAGLIIPYQIYVTRTLPLAEVTLDGGNKALDLLDGDSRTFTAGFTPDGLAVDYSWDVFPNAGFTASPGLATGPRQTSLKFTQPGTYTVTVAVTDKNDANNRSTASHTVTVTSKVDLNALYQSAIKKYTESGKYSAASWNAYQAQLSAVKTVLGKEAGTQTQAQINAAEAALRNAINALVGAPYIEPSALPYYDVSDPGAGSLTLTAKLESESAGTKTYQWAVTDGPVTYVLNNKTDATCFFTPTGAGAYTLKATIKLDGKEYAATVSITAVDKGALRTELALADSVNTSGYTARTVDAFTAALTAAELVLAGTTETQDAINGAAAALKSAREGLRRALTANDITIVPQPLQVWDLADTRSRVFTASCEPGYPVAYAWKVISGFESGITGGGDTSNVTFAPPDPGNYILRVTVTDPEDAQNTHYQDLSFPVVDKTELNALINTAESLRQEDFIDEGWAFFVSALAEAKAVQENTALTLTQAKINTAAEALRQRMNELHPKLAGLTVTPETDVYLDLSVAQTAQWTASVEPKEAVAGYRWSVSPAVSGLTGADTATVQFKPEATGSYRLTIDVTGVGGDSLTKTVYVIVVDKTQLKAQIAIAADVLSKAVVGSGHGEYPQAAVDKLNAAVRAAQAVRDAESAQPEIHITAAALQDAIAEFTGQSNVVDASRLNALILTARQRLNDATFGERNGDYPPDEKVVFTGAIEAAEMTATKPNRTSDEVLAAISALEQAMEHFNTTVVVVQYGELAQLADLCESIHQNAAEGTQNGQYQYGAKAVFLTEIKKAQAVAKNQRATQNEVDAAKEALQKAMEEFAGKRIGVNYDVLVSLITQAEKLIKDSAYGDRNGEFPPKAKAELEQAVAAAQAAADNTSATQAQVDAAVDKLQTAITAFGNSRIVVDYQNLKDLIQTATNALDAADIGSGDGQYPAQAAKALQEAIQQAQTVAENPLASQQTVTDAHNALNQALTAFHLSKITVDRAALAGKVEQANGQLARSEPGDLPGQYPQNAVNALQAAIGTAQAVLATEAVTQEALDKATAELEQAMAVFTASVNKEPEKPVTPPQTGDTVSIRLWACLLAAATFVFVITGKKRKQAP